MLFVFSAFDQLPARMLAYPRLYAFPREPDPPGDTFVILDSGAFGLAQRGCKIDERYMARLATYYAQYQSPCFICVAPDVFLDPVRTFANYLVWQRKYSSLRIAPVLQARKEGILDLYDLRRLVNNYLSYLDAWPRLGDRPVLMLGNPGLYGLSDASRAAQSLSQIIRQAVPNVWLHLLGAGWSLMDIGAWAQLGAFDSIDSIAYYEDAKRGISWQGAASKDWRETAANNAEAIRRVLHNFAEGQHV